ncbi:MAG: sugar transferase [Bacteroidota bacterium]
MYNFSKRLLDIIGSLILLTIFLPLFLMIIVALLLTGDHEVFYLQERIGKNNTPFKIIKFATMVKNSSNMGTGSITLRNDPRVTKVGKYLRLSKLNELPQILNVLIGNMSFVGPRPLMRVSFENYSNEIKTRIYNKKPGITGIGSLFFRDEERLVSEAVIPPEKFYKKYIYPYKGLIEIWYHDNASFYLDIKIIYLTIYHVIFIEKLDFSKFFPNLPQPPNELL